MRLLAWLILLLPLSAVADERILSFHSDISILPDSTLEVTETIRVRAEGRHIRRGIYRDFPVDYEDHLGNKFHITLEPLSVTRNDQREAFHTRRSGRDVRTYFGQSDRFIDHGEHTYRFRYRVNRQLGFFEQHDELYWNVTGNRWMFPIDKASATVSLRFEDAVDAVLVDGYTGRYGSSEQDYSRRRQEDGSIYFEANQALPAAHGLTIVVGWPKGHVVEPTKAQEIVWLIQDNRNLLAAVLGLVALLLYYIPVWRKYGRDPDEGVVFTRYEPPSGFSPASLRYIRQMYYDNKVMTAAIVSLATKGYLKIKKSGDTHVLKKDDPRNAHARLPAGELELYGALFKGRKSVSLKNSNHEVLGAARKIHEQSLKDDYKHKYFVTNGGMNIPAILIVIVSTVIALASGDGPNRYVIATVIAMFVVMAFFAIIMKRPTIRGRKVLDEILGFRDYLEVAEKDELNLRNPPEKTPELFEKLLPFALALGVDQAWSEKFAAVLGAIRGPDDATYSPSWYDGHWNSANLSETATNLSHGLNSAINSSVTPPGSSSGGGGGGFSGGGGGGGGGGGW